MKDLYRLETNEQGISMQEIEAALEASIRAFQQSDRLGANEEIKKVLILPPDITRMNSQAGIITNLYYQILNKLEIQVDIMPAIGTHRAMSEEEIRQMYGDIPQECFLEHRWRDDVISLGEIPGFAMSEMTEGVWKTPIEVEVNRIIMDPSYDLILSIGQVVPHEVVGMANHAKNIFVGIGGKDMINKSHMVGALYGLERIMGRDETPVRKMFDYGMEHFLNMRPIMFVLTVTTVVEQCIRLHGLFIGTGRECFTEAVKLAQKENITYLPKKIKKCVVYLDPMEFRSTWIGNKAIYRTRMAIEDGGELLILAPGIERFGEDPKVDELIRKYGYCGREKILSLLKEEGHEDLYQNMAATAHLIHGSVDGKFKIKYAVEHITEDEMHQVGYHTAQYHEIIKKYNPQKLEDGYHIMPDKEEIYYISNPAIGLWIAE